jgi:hypothetical protein
LANGGVMVQWIQIAETSDQTLQSMVKTFTTVFPFVSVWRSQDHDIVLIGTPQPRRVDLQAFLTRMADPAVHADLERGTMSEPLALLSREVASPETGAFVSARETPVHSDYFPSLEYMAQVGFFVGARSTLYDTVTETHSPRATTLLAAYLKNQPHTVEYFQRAAKAYLDRQFLDDRLVHGLMEQWSLVETNSSLPLEIIHRLTLPETPALLEESRLLPRHRSLLEEGRGDVTILQFYERALMQGYRAKRSTFYIPDTQPLQEVLAILRESDPTNQRVFNLHMAELAWDRGDDARFVQFATLAVEPAAKNGPMQFSLDEDAPRIVLHHMIEASLRSGNIAQAQAACAHAATNHYLDRDDHFYAPLELVCRKVQSIADSNSK